MTHTHRRGIVTARVVEARPRARFDRSVRGADAKQRVSLASPYGKRKPSSSSSLCLFIEPDSVNNRAIIIGPVDRPIVLNLSVSSARFRIARRGAREERGAFRPRFERLERQLDAGDDTVLRHS